MASTRKMTRLVSLFVMAFLCLNVSGVLCLTYCGQVTVAKTSISDDSHLSEHCRLAKQKAEKENKGNLSIDANSASCCSLPISMFAAPIEERNLFSVDAPVAAAM